MNFQLFMGEHAFQYYCWDVCQISSDQDLCKPIYSDSKSYNNTDHLGQYKKNM